MERAVNDAVERALVFFNGSSNADNKVQGPRGDSRPFMEITGEGLPPLSSDPDRESVYDSESDRSRSLCYRLARNFMRCPHAQTNRPLARRADHGEGPVTGFAKQCSPPHNGDGLLRRVASSQ